MARLGDVRTRTLYTEAVDLGRMGVVTGASVVALLSGYGVTGLGPKSGFVMAVVNQLSGTKLSQYKVKFVIKEKYIKTKIFDTDQWIEANIWSVIDMKSSIIKK